MGGGIPREQAAGAGDAASTTSRPPTPAAIAALLTERTGLAVQYCERVPASFRTMRPSTSVWEVMTVAGQFFVVEDGGEVTMHSQGRLCRSAREAVRRHYGVPSQRKAA